MLKVIGFLFLLSLSYSYECNEEGYDAYLVDLEKAKETATYTIRFDNYVTRCNRLTEVKKTCGFASFTSLMDWSDEELDELGKLGVEYSGNPIIYTEVDPITQEEMSVEKRSRDFSSLGDYNAPEKKCSTSWATAAIRAAEAALNYEVELSEEQLFTCLPKDLGFADGCEGIHPKKLMDYLLEDGLVEKSAFDGCDKLDGLKRYHFGPTIPDTLTASGLMNLLAKENKPAFVMMAINLKELVFVKDMTNIKDVVKCGGYQPSLYGVVTGYKYSENGGSAWWEVVTNVIPGEEIVMKIPVSSNMYNANYAGIAAYAFTLSEVIVYEDLVIATEDDCDKLNDLSRVKSLTVNEGLCNDMENDLVIANYPGLKEIVIKPNSLKKLNSLTIYNNAELVKIETEDKEHTQSDQMIWRDLGGAFSNVKSVVIKSTIIDNSLIDLIFLNSLHSLQDFSHSG